MSFRPYATEKSGKVCRALAWIAEAVQQMPAGPEKIRIRAHLSVAVSHACRLVAISKGVAFDPEWIEAVMQGGSSAWQTISESNDGEPLSSFGPEPKNDPELAARSAKVTSALLDLNEALQTSDLSQSSPFVPSTIADAFVDVTKVLYAAHGFEWESDWATQLAKDGRKALPSVLQKMETTLQDLPLDRAAFEPLDEAWLAEADPSKTQEKLDAAERQRRLAVTEETRISGDLLVPPRYQKAELSMMVKSIPEHRACIEYAHNPSRKSLILKGSFPTGLHGIQYAIGRYWFSQKLHKVFALDWWNLVSNNLLAQNRHFWQLPFLLICQLRSVFVDDHNKADPGYAEKLLVHRIREGFPTLMTLEGAELDDLNLSQEGENALKQAIWISLPVTENKSLH